jgi:hypothetical protein
MCTILTFSLRDERGLSWKSKSLPDMFRLRGKNRWAADGWAIHAPKVRLRLVSSNLYAEMCDKNIQSGNCRRFFGQLSRLDRGHLAVRLPGTLS